MSAECRPCAEFNQSHLVRRAIAEAGKGLPPIEPGQPQPAGTGLNRRSFLLRSSATLLSVYGASKLGVQGFEEGIARAAGGSDPVLVTVFLDGGIDSLSVLAPTSDPRYRSLRPTLAVADGTGTAFSEDERLRWHPAAAAFDNLHRAGRLTVVPAVGYESPNQSHFTSRHFWEVGALEPSGTTGWMGRLLDRIGAVDNPLQGLSLGGQLSPTMATESVPVAAILGTGYDISQHGVTGEVESLLYESVAAIGAAASHGKDLGLASAGGAADHAMRVRSQLSPFASGQVNSPVAYPSGFFPGALRGLSAMLAAGMPIRCAALSAPGGYDTHHNQASSFSSNLKLAAESLAAFQGDLEARGIANRVITLVWSEFGRRPQENGSAGTDHGAGGLGLLMGTRVRGRMIGEWPGLERLDARDNLLSTSDFRGIYCSLIEQWFGVDATSIIPGAQGFARPAIVQ